MLATISQTSTFHKMKLYKYRDLRSAWNTLDIILNRRLYLAPLASLNDPMEVKTVQAKIVMEASLREFEIDYSKIPSESDLRFATELGLIEAGYDHGTLGDIVLSANTRYYSRICSLSANPRNITMWSHYANGHQGICLELEIAAAMPVRYYCSKKLELLFSREHIAQLLSRINDKTNAVTLKLVYITEKLQKLHISKTDDWLYEQEWRILRDERNRYYDLKDGEYLSKILVGERISSLHYDILKKLSPSHVPVVKTMIINGEVREIS
jgi:hypothetical protein